MEIILKSQYVPDKQMQLTTRRLLNEYNKIQMQTYTTNKMRHVCPLHHTI